MKLLVAGIGNIFLGDDAFGVEVARRLGERQLPAGVRVVDFGIRSYDLAYALMEDWELAILVDALPRGGEPGTVYVVEPDLQDALEPNLDAHSMNPVSVLQLVSALGGEVNRILVVGCEPARLEGGEGEFELSPPVEAAVEEAIRAIEEIVVQTMTRGTAAA